MSERLSAVILGAGFSGPCMAIRLKRPGILPHIRYNANVVFSRIGGSVSTWVTSTDQSTSPWPGFTIFFRQVTRSFNMGDYVVRTQ